jgi:FkbM family methyltransferase
LRELRGMYERGRRRLRTALLKPILLRRTFRELVLNVVAERGHLIYARSDTDGTAFFVDPSDRAVGAALIWEGDWQRRELIDATKFLQAAGRFPQGAVFVDAGANIGTQTIYALKAGYARAVSFEPEASNATLLAMNVAANGLTDRVQIVNRAVGDAPGTVVLHLHPRNKGNHTIGTAPSYDGMQRIDVPIVRLDTGLAAAGVTPAQVGLIWIDVEGYEPQAIRGLGAFLEARVPMVIEYSPTRYTADGRRALLDLLSSHYQIFRYLDADGADRPIAELDTIHSGHRDVMVY